MRRQSKDKCLDRFPAKLLHKYRLSMVNQRSLVLECLNSSAQMPMEASQLNFLLIRRRMYMASSTFNLLTPLLKEFQQLDTAQD